VRYRKRQNYWNRPSLAVEYDIVTGAYRVDRWRFDGRSLRMLRRGVSGPRLDVAARADYDAYFRRRHFRAVWRNKLVNLARNPRLPRARHVRSLLNILRESRGG
jgi:hypothetical protein